jgi:Ser/Thr protein kinase RdoA (MazF antagonist)
MVLHKILLDPNLIKESFKAYRLDVAQIQDSQTGYRNHSFPAVLIDGRVVNLILYKSEPHILKKIKTANAVSNFLHEQGLPVRHPIDSRILKLKSLKAERYGAVYNYLPGHTIPWDSYTRIHLKTLGETMANMHKDLGNMPKICAPDIAQEYILIFERMKNYFDNSQTSGALSKKLSIGINPAALDYYLKILSACQGLPKQQILHMDFVRGNILFNEKNGTIFVSGILDFEKAGYGHLLLDVARTLAFLLVDCKYKTEYDIHKNFLILGYVRAGKINFNNIVLKSASRRINLLEELTKMFMMHDFYKFLRHNPYEFLPENEHFVRTRDYLLTQKLLVSARSQASIKSVKIS